MDYLFAAPDNFHDFAGGKVIRSRPGIAAFPVRLASELFLRASAYLQESGNFPPYHIYDPVCGGGYSLTALGFLHRTLIRRISASDIDSEAVRLATANLSLLTPNGLQSRLNELSELALKYDKPSHATALASVLRFQESMAAHSQELSVHAFEADALNASSMQCGLGTDKVDLLFADVPYGRLSKWHNADEPVSGESAASALLVAMAGMQIIPKIIILATSKQDRPQHSRFKRLRILQNGKRRISIFQSLA